MGFEAFLSQAFDDRRRRNRRYSVRAFARDLGCDHATLSQWMRGKRPMTPPVVDQLGAALGLDEAACARAREFDPFDPLVIDAIRATARPTTPRIAIALGATPDRVNMSLHRLLRLGHLRMNGAAWIATAGTTRR